MTNPNCARPRGRRFIVRLTNCVYNESPYIDSFYFKFGKSKLNEYQKS